MKLDTTPREAFLSLILSELRKRGITMRLDNGRLLVTPAGKLDDALKAAMRERRAELEEWVGGSLLSDVLKEFGGEVIATWGSEIKNGDTVAEHTPATLVRGCYGHLPACQRYSLDQLSGYTASALASTGEGCGDCTIFHAGLKIDGMKQKREKIEAREAARARANHFAMAQQEAREEDEG